MEREKHNFDEMEGTFHRWVDSICLVTVLFLSFVERVVVENLLGKEEVSDSNRDLGEYFLSLQLHKN